MSKTTEFIEKITQKLHHDRELRLDISHELQTHLDEAIEEYKASDYSQEDAATQAIKDMGDPDELAEDLWQANRLRMKLRAWCWWIARLSLWPVCVLAIMWFVLSSASSSGVLHDVDQMALNETKASFPLEKWAGRWKESQLRSRMTPEQRLIAFGDERQQDRIQQWKALRDAYPDQPLYQLHYILQLLPKWNGKAKQFPFIEDIQTMNQELDRGQQLDPDNGVYDLIKAMTLLPTVDYERDQSISYSSPMREDIDEERSHPNMFKQQQDPALIEQIMMSLSKAMDHRYIASHDLDMLRHRMEQLPPAHTMREYIFRIQNAIGINLPLLTQSRKLARYVSAAAMERAKQGNKELAVQWLDILDHWQRKQAASAQASFELLVVRSIKSMILEYRIAIGQVSGDMQLRKQAYNALAAGYKEFDEEVRVRNGQASAIDVDQHGGILMRMLLPAIPGYKINVQPFRKAEYAMLDRGVLTLVLTALVIFAGGMSLASTCRMVFGKKSQYKPVLLWIGWWQLLKLMLMGLILPVAIFAAMTQTPLLGRQWGINYNVTSLVWYLPFLGCMTVLFGHIANNALRRRALQLGMEVPSSRGYTNMLLSLAVYYFLSGLPLLVYALFRAANDKNPYASATLFVACLIYLLIGLCKLGSDIGWMHRDPKWLKHLCRELWVGCAWMVCVCVVLCLAIFICLELFDIYAFVLTVLMISIPNGFLIALIRYAKRKHPCQWFAVSAIRSMSLLMLLGALTLALTVGPVLDIVEAHYAKQMTEQSSIFIDMEIKRSNLQIIKTRWAQGEVEPPAMIPAHGR